MSLETISLKSFELKFASFIGNSPSPLPVTAGISCFSALSDVAKAMIKKRSPSLAKAHVPVVGPSDRRTRGYVRRGCAKPTMPVPDLGQGTTLQMDQVQQRLPRSRIETIGKCKRMAQFCMVLYVLVTIASEPQVKPKLNQDLEANQRKRRCSH